MKRQLIQYKSIKKILKITAITLGSLLLLLIALLCSLRFAFVQNFVTQQAVHYFAKELNTTVTIESLYFTPFSSIAIQQFSMMDRQGKKMIYVERLEADVKLSQLFNNRITLSALKLKDAAINLEIYKDSNNFTFLTDYFAQQENDKQQKKQGMRLDLGKIIFDNNQIRLLDHRYTSKPKGVNFADLAITNFSATLADIAYDTRGVKAQISKLSLKEKSGFIIRNFEADAHIGTERMEFSNLLLQTNRSHAGDYVLFEYQNFHDFTDFMEKVRISSDLRNTFIDSRDIEFFAPDLKFVKFKTTVARAALAGTVANFSVRIFLLKTGNNSLVEGDFTIQGLPAIDETIFQFDLKQLRTTAQDIEKLVPQLANKKTFPLPELLHKLGTVTYKGKLKGYYHQFNLDGAATTSLGLLQTNSDIDIRKDFSYKGTVASTQFEVGKFINNNLLGHTGFDFAFEGHGTAFNTLQLQLNGALQRAQINGYTYESILLNSHIQDQLLHADGSIADPNARLAFTGDIDWNQIMPTYWVSSTIEQVNLKAIHLYEKDSIRIKNTEFSTSIAGNSLNSLNGELTSASLNLASSRGDFKIDSILFRSSGDEKNRELRLQSDVVDGHMIGNIDLNTVGEYFKSLAMRYAPAIAINTKPYNSQNFDLAINIKSFKPISALFDPQLSLEDGASLQAQFSSDSYLAKFEAFSPKVVYKGMRLTNVSLSENADVNAFSLAMRADKLNFSDSTYIDNIQIDTKLANDSLNFNIALSEAYRSNFMDLTGHIHFALHKPAIIHIHKSIIRINHEDWLLNQQDELRLSQGRLYVKNLTLSRASQKLTFNGMLAPADDQLRIDFQQFKLASFAGLTQPFGIQLEGDVNGNIALNDIFKKPRFTADLSTNTIQLNKQTIGALKLLAAYESEEGIVSIKANLMDEQQRGVDLAGKYDFNDSEKPLNLHGRLQDFDLQTVQPFLKNLVSNLRGTATGDLQIQGRIQQPMISGLQQLKNTSFLVNYLNTTYTLDNQAALFDKNAIIINNFKFQDLNQQTATANGIINLNNISDPTIDIDVSANNFQVLHTNAKNNPLYYGTVYATGQYKFKGLTSAMNINIKASSNPHTVITIPFNSSSKISDSDFIYFVSSDANKNIPIQPKKLFKGLTMNIDLLVTPDAEVNLENNIGSLKGVGHGAISLRISSLGDFEMFGDYDVTSGKFHFTAQDYFNKYFDLKEGGTVRWAGDPGEGIVNLTAIYQQRTSVAPLYNAAGRTENTERVLAQSDMILKGSLNQPAVSFDLNFPQAPYIKDELQGYLSDINNVNQQALSLIIRRSFTPGSTQEFSKEVNNTLLSAGTEIAFNQLNNIISQSLRVNFFDLNIRSFNDASASLRFFNDRLIFTGGVSDRSSIQLTDLSLFSNRVATDAELTFRLRKDGNLIMRAYNRLNTRNFLFNPYDDYISAAGLVYRQEFNSLSEFWRKLWLWNDSKPAGEKKKTEK